MTQQEARARVNAIKSVMHDPEHAHILEDELYADIVRYVAEEAPEPFKSVAKEALRTEKLDFARWYA